MNTHVLAVVVLLLAGAQAYPHQAEDYPDLSTIEFLPNANLAKWIEVVASRVQAILDTTFSEWTFAIDIVNVEALDIIELTTRDAEQHGPGQDKPNARDCIQEHTKRLGAILSAAANGVGTCVGRALNQTAELQADLQDHVKAIRAEGRKVGEVIKKCKENPSSTLVCIRDNLKTIGASVKIILSETLELLIASNAQATVIVEQAKRCVKDVADNVRSQTTNSHGILRKCLENALRP